ncbi:MAG: MBL fold metallo-hydrolase [Deltaproteobacteria bacterium]|nr:MBL fold metallo-hydrolase [Deltaproteobacteria bacterium]
MQPWIQQLAVGPMANFTYLLGDPHRQTAIVIDPGWEAERILGAAATAGYRIEGIWLTHTHPDHIGALEELLGNVPVPVHVHEAECGQCTGLRAPVRPTRDGDRLTVGAVAATCLHTPGHTPGGQCFFGDGFLFTGDTLFVDSIGRTDLPGSDPQQMFASLRRLAQLPPETAVYSGHDYGRTPTSTIGEQVQRNRFLQLHTLAQFLRQAG